MKLRNIKRRAYVISQRLAERKLWKLEVIYEVAKALKELGFVHDTSKPVEWVAPRSLAIVEDAVARRA